MNPKIVFAFALLAIAHQAQSACLCNNFGEGKDLCSSSGPRCAPLVIRPANLPRINPEVYTKPRVVCQTIGGGLQSFKPIGDLCSCRQSIVTPALVPRPVCACSSSSSSSSNSNANSNSASSCGGAIYLGPSSSSVGHADSYIVEEQGPTAAIVDPVSLALAYKAANKGCGVSEARLAYGFRKLPVEIVQEKRSAPEINEHGLYMCNGQIVELKKIGCGQTVSVDDEALEQLENEAEAEEIEAVQGGPIKTLRYGDVGFGVATIKKNPFREVVGVVEANPQPVETVKRCDDGYKPGTIRMKNTLLREAYEPAPGVPADCASSAEDYRPYFKYSTSSSKSSSSNSDCHRCDHSKVYY